jgi:hypothetical protein
VEDLSADGPTSRGVTGRDDHRTVTSERSESRPTHERTIAGDEIVIDYSAATSDGDRGIMDLSPAWDLPTDPWTVGYEPVGETSLGVEQERRASSRRSRFGVPATKLALHQEGRHPSDGTQSRRLAALDKKRITQSLCSSLEIPRYQQAEAVRAMLELDLTAFGNQKRIERVALAVIEVIMEYELRYRRRDPNGPRLADNPEFKYLARSVGLIPGKMVLSRKVKRQLSDIGFFEPGAPGMNLSRDVYFSEWDHPDLDGSRYSVHRRTIPVRTNRSPRTAAETEESV